ncbi:PAS domain S-box protein [Hymenobacter antarcticus]|uniref:histidine kinase n=1 Tax=Hymenobacter antarcticus TaxID=486270 RepID=A0ABP7QIW0_9BACT
MPAVSSFSDAEWAQQLAAERARREHAEAELAQMRARLAALEQPVAAPFHTLRTQIGALVHNLRLGVVLVDGSGLIQYVSPHFWRLFGLEPVAGPPPFAASQLPIAAAFADPDAFHARAWALHAAGKTVLGEVFRLRDGRRLVLDYLVLDEAGAGRVICYRDVTQAHRRKQQRLRMLAAVPEQNPNPILRLAPSGEVLYANPAAAPLVEALRTTAAEVLPSLLALARAMRQGTAPGPQELTVAGQYYLVTAALVPGGADTTLYFTNITDRRLAEEWLGRQRIFYESVLEQVPIPVAVFDDEHRYLFINSSAEPDPALRTWMLGKTSTEACVRRQHPAASAQQRAAAFAEVLRTGGEMQWEETLPMADGPDRHSMLWYRPVRGLAGIPLVISLAIDLTERKQAEQRVIQQQEFYESILNLLPFDVAVFDAEHRFRFVNPATIADPAVREQIIGLTNAEYFGLRQLRYPELGRLREQYFDLAVRTRTDVTWEEEGLDRRGRPQLMVRHLRPVFGADGGLRLVVGSGIDITARYLAENLQHQVQDMLREQEAFIRQIVDALPNGLHLIEPGGNISFSNRVFNERLNDSAHLTAAEPKPEVVAREIAVVRALNREVLRTGQPETREISLTLNSGEQRYCQVYMQPLRRANGQVGVLTISTDVTEMKRTLQELERREKQYHDLVHYSQALICTHDLQGILLSVNPAIERLLGWSAAEVVGRSLDDLLAPAHLPGFQAYLNDLQTVHPQDRHMTIRTRTGNLRYLRNNSYLVVEAGCPSYVVASGYDVTAGVLAQRALEQAKREAEDNALAKENFLARMSHEIRTPLNGVLGMAALLHKTPLSAQQTDYLTAMQQAGLHLLSLLNDVLDMAKITAHHLQLNPAPFDLAELLARAGQAVAALAATKGLALEVQPPSGGPLRVAGDAYRLHQILLNLLANAIKFTEQGRIGLGADVLAETPADLTLRFWVVDTGIGIDPTEQAHIFEAFAQASADTSQRFGGTGLGLAISQQLVEQMGGMLALHSVPGQGSTFSFELHLPRAAGTAPAASSAAEARPTFEGLRGLRVLLAEDNHLNQLIARAVLEYWGVAVVAVSNGTDALAQLRGHDYDAAILDIRMPGLSGVEVTTALRLLPDARRAGLPIIALTANAFETDRLAYLAAGMNACLIKPYEEADLCQLLLDLTNK